MNEMTRRLMSCKNLGMVLFDNVFKIVESNKIAENILKTFAQPADKTNLLEIFPEFIGSEKLIQDLVNSKTTDFQLDYVNRSGGDGKTNYFHLIVLPDDDPALNVLIIEDVTERATMLQEVNQQKYELLLYKSSEGFKKQFLSESFLGESPFIQDVRDNIDKLSQVPTSTVLLLGESGTGKSLVARIIHYSSMPPDAPFVDINCAALPENLIESELFGYEKGAFTHATTSRMGLLQEAEGGTIFLDEIGELPFNLQAKLLSVLETKKFRRLGSNNPIGVKARIIAATNRNLQKDVVEEKFRKDLYYRLDIVSLTLPPLRKLGEDILTIANHIITIFNVEFNKNVKGFTKAARQTLLDYKWPGNVRELSNCLERAMIFNESEWIDETDIILSNLVRTQEMLEWKVPSTGIVLEDVERQLIISALRQAGENKTKAARLLGFTRDTLRYRLEKYNLS